MMDTTITDWDVVASAKSVIFMLIRKCGLVLSFRDFPARPYSEGNEGGLNPPPRPPEYFYKFELRKT